MSDTFERHDYACNGQTIHALVAGPVDAPVMLMLHGFPEYSAAWAKVAPHFADRYRVVLPDQRGFARSSKPTDPAAYDTKHLVADMVALLDHVSPDAPVILCGHDWGASVAYALAMRHANRVSRFIVANGVHPVCFQGALLSDPAQRAASQYMTVLRAEGAAARMVADDFARTLRMLSKFSATHWLGDDERAAYRAAWADEATMDAMLNWYRRSPMEVPGVDEPLRDLPVTEAMREKYRISMPHLVVWGVDDTALLPSARTALPAFCDDLTVRELEKASHWLLHERPDAVAAEIAAFLDR